MDRRAFISGALAALVGAVLPSGGKPTSLEAELRSHDGVWCVRSEDINLSTFDMVPGNVIVVDVPRSFYIPGPFGSRDFSLG